MILEYPLLAEIFAADGFDLTPARYAAFGRYAALLAEWNGKINLTGITDPRGISLKHFLDSVLPLKFLDVPEGAALIDVGTGAGFPGLPMKIMRNGISLTLLDSLNKRVNFLSEVCKAIELDSKCIHGRAEDFGRNSEYREKFDIAAARAVAAMPVLAEYCLPFVKVGGTFAALKGKNEDYRESENAVKILGGEISEVKEYALPDGDGRTLICVKKIRETPGKYPRNSGQISKKTL
ncbi:MAG: 16S rRNA (guanine(527)-N(7))-methyltransferase RsmG [Ruminococcus sp.]|nr:16S rRNA (guanine(527)-N(7))-methyltransferase RsmG [Ruminococcus sp.]MCM1380794.1 16S rRNA (guanine(527)-N(7))-methyltransferase RsmG [Muribaculaceae bacterium]MCM1478487.1 16S rRNA (guanine(527)-N(7))-methyltransferase RsmG [Muribaculaceae bacterium]